MSYLAASHLLAQHLRENLIIPAVNVREAVSLEWVIDKALSPSVNIIFFDDVPCSKEGGNPSNGHKQFSDQYWLIVITVRNVTDAGVAALQDSAVLIETTLKALQGHVLSEKHRLLIRQKCPYRKTDRSGYVHFPLLFSTRILT
jgi:hypothetical protein